MKGKIIAAFLLIIGTSCRAQDSVKTLNEVIVTPNKFPQKQSETGKVVVVIDKSTLEKSEGKTVSQLLNEQAGITVNGSLNNLGTNPSVYARGAGSGRTLVTVDGVPMNDPSLIDNGFDLNSLAVDNIERIEIYKGAQSTLYGSDAIAGVINIITINPNITKTLNFKSTAAAGSFGTFKYNLQLFGKIKDKLTYNLRYTHLRSEGFSSAYDSTGKGNFDKDGYRGGVFTGDIAYAASPHFTIRAFGQSGFYITGLDAGGFSDAKDYTSTNKDLMLGAGAIYKWGGTTINGNYYYNNNDRHIAEDSVFGQYYLTDRFHGQSHHAEIYANSKLGPHFTWLNGASYHSSLMNEKSNYGKFDDTTVHQQSVYSSLFFSSGSGLNIEAGGRFNHHSGYGNSFTYTFNPSFVFDKNWKVYGSISSGFKVPSLYQLYSAYGDPHLKAETSTSFETGIEYSGRKLNSRLTGFYNKIRHGLDYDYGKNVYFNFDKENDYGIEWENKLRINRVISISANYTLLKAKEQTQSRIPYAFDPSTYQYSFNDTLYHYSLRKPTHTINARLDVQATKNWLISVATHYESKRYDASYVSADVVLGPFVIFNAYSEYKIGKTIKLFVDVKNITGKKFFTIYGYNAIPAEIMGGITLKL